VSEEELVSSDFLGRGESAIVDLPLTRTTGSLLRVVAWYDNEWGHASRLADLVALAGAPAAPTR
jgi:glyceraldehyde 3-phosphate dehydrogenase